jgi:hypothetical protein
MVAMESVTDLAMSMSTLTNAVNCFSTRLLILATTCATSQDCFAAFRSDRGELFGALGCDSAAIVGGASI